MKENLHIIEELNDIAPSLAVLKSKEINLPTEDYFQSMQDVIFAKIIEDKQDKELDNMPDTNYFNKMQAEVMSKVKDSPKRLTMTFFKWSAAACFLLLSVYLLKENIFNTNKIDNQLVINIESDDEMNYLLNYVAEDDILKYVNSSKISDINEVDINLENNQIEKIVESDVDLEIINEIL